MFGIPPQLARPVHDLTGSSLTQRQIRRIGAAARNIERRFPQVQPAVVLTPSTDPSPLAARAFWIFNRGALFSAADSGGENHGVLLLIDTDHSRAAVMMGYGLEILMPDEALKACVDATRPALAEKNFAGASIAFLESLAHQLDSTVDLARRAFGLEKEDLWFSNIHDLRNGAIVSEF